MNDDLDEEIVDSDEGFDEFSQKSALGNAVRQSPVAKIIVVVLVLAVVIGVMVLFSGEKETETVSSLPAGSEVTSVPGTDQEVAPAYVEAVEQQNEADLDRAYAEGGSAIPVPIKTPDTRLEIPEVEEETEDPLHRWRLLQEERVERQMKVKENEAEPVTVLDAEQQVEAINNLAEAMVQQMQSVLSRNNETKDFSTKTLISYKDSAEAGTAAAGEGSGAQEGAEPFEEVSEQEVIIPAGKIVYGQLLLEANSDVPYTVMAQMVSGPLKGWKLLGNFEMLDNVEMLGIKFNKAVNSEGKTYTVDAIMLNPDTGLAAMRTDIDHRYLQRIIFPAAAEFISGYAGAIADSGKTSVYVTGDTVVESSDESTDEEEVATGIQQAGDKISDIVDEMGDVEVKIIIAAGTPIGIFFADNVVEDEEGI